MKWLVPLLLLCFVAWVVVGRGPVLRPGGPAPPIQAGRWFNNANSGSGPAIGEGVTVVEFWATWCPPCLDSIEHLNRLQKRWADRGVRVVGLTDEPAEVVAQFMKKKPMRYIVGAESRSGDDYGVTAIPQTFVIDRQGQIVWSGYPNRALDRAVAAAVEAEG